MKHSPAMLLKIKDKSTYKCRMHLVPPIPAINGIFGSLVTFYTQLTLKWMQQQKYTFQSCEVRQYRATCRVPGGESPCCCYSKIIRDRTPKITSPPGCKHLLFLINVNKLSQLASPDRAGPMADDTVYVPTFAALMWISWLRWGHWTLNTEHWTDFISADFSGDKSPARAEQPLPYPASLGGGLPSRPHEAE